MKSFIKSGIFLALVVLVIIGRYFWQKPRFVNGENIPSLKATLADGTPFDLTLLKGKYILLDFWGSWCGPCRAANPSLVRLYDKYHEKGRGLEIVSIGIERNKNSWQRAIEQDSLKWKYHISDLQYFDSPLAKQYGVREIPTTYLLDPDGVIIGVNLEESALDKLLLSRIEK